MQDVDRDQRLQDDLVCLTGLRDGSSIFQFAASGNPPDRYGLTFRGRGISRASSSRTEVEWIDLHEIDMRLPFSYPDLPPDIRWVTPILHPNVSFSGFIQLRDVGLPWDRTVTLDAVCERLWDVARLAYVNLDRATNFSAKSWIESPGRIALPVDTRILRDRMNVSGINVIRYARRGAARSPLPRSSGEVLYIGEDTPAPPLPPRRPPPRPAPGGDDDILYIDD